MLLSWNGGALKTVIWILHCQERIQLILPILFTFIGFQVNPEKKKRAPAEGYENTTLLFKQEKASEFIMGNNPIHVLNNCHEIAIDQARIKKHKKTTQGT